MDGVIRTGLGWPEEGFRPGLRGSSAALRDLLPVVGRLGEEVSQLFPHRSFGAQAQVGGDLFSGPVPDGLSSIEIRTVPRQVHQSQVQVGGNQVGPQGVAMMGWSVVPDDLQWSGVLLPQLLQEGGGGLGVRDGGGARLAGGHEAPAGILYPLGRSGTLPPGFICPIRKGLGTCPSPFHRLLTPFYRLAVTSGISGWDSPLVRQ